MNDLEVTVKLQTPAKTAKIVFVCIKTEPGGDQSVYRIYPTDQENQIDSKRDLTPQAKMDLCAMRDALQVVFGVNGMDFETDEAADYYAMQARGRYEQVIDGGLK